MNRAPAYAIDSVDNALLLLLLLRREGRVRVASAAESLGVARSTAHRLLAMLKYRGFVVQDRDRSYVAGPALRTHAAAEAPDGGAIIRERLELLHAEVNETVNYVVRVGGNVRFVETIEGAPLLRVVTPVGTMLPAYATSGGKALLAELADARVLRLAPHTRDDPAAQRDLIQEISSTRARGYGVNLGESESGVAAIGAVVRRTDGIAIGALTVAAPAQRYPRDTIRQLAPLLLQAARDVREDLERAGI